MSVTRIQIVLSNEVPEPQEAKTPARPAEPCGKCKEAGTRRAATPPATIIA
jgi:hypothetical protein